MYRLNEYVYARIDLAWKKFKLAVVRFYYNLWP
jgi:hypothetical protein